MRGFLHTLGLVWLLLPMVRGNSQDLPPLTPASGTPPGETTNLKPPPSSTGSATGGFLEDSRKSAERIQGLRDGTIKLGGNDPTQATAAPSLMSGEEVEAAKKVLAAMRKKTIGPDALQTLGRVEQKLAEMQPGFLPAPDSAEGADRVNALEEAVKRMGPRWLDYVENIPADYSLDQRINQLSMAVALREMDLEQEQRQQAWVPWIILSAVLLAAVAGYTVIRRRGRAKSSPRGVGKPAKTPSLPTTAASAPQSAEPVAMATDVLASPVRRPRRIFISFATPDLDYVQNQLAPALREAGQDPWFSKVSIQPSDEWERSILAALRKCDWFLVVMSPHALQSKWVQLEVHWATEHREGRILPLMLESCDPWQLHMKLGNLQYVNCGHSAHAMAEIVRLIEMREINQTSSS